MSGESARGGGIRPPVTIEYDALLFDMDGTIFDSTPAIVKYWLRMGEEIGVDGNEILKTSHGRRSIDVLSILAPPLANWDYVCKAEGRIPQDFGADASEVPGSRSLLESLDAVDAPWAIVTSGTTPLVTGWLEVMKLAQPKHMVTAEEVENGKPDPACYLLGAKRLGFEPEDGKRILVLEDAPAGVRAGKAAGFDVVGLLTTHTYDDIKTAGADWIVKDLRSVKFLGLQTGTRKIKIEISNAVTD